MVTKASTTAATIAKPATTTTTIAAPALTTVTTKDSTTTTKAPVPATTKPAGPKSIADMFVKQLKKEESDDKAAEHKDKEKEQEKRKGKEKEKKGTMDSFFKKADDKPKDDKKVIEIEMQSCSFFVNAVQKEEVNLTPVKSEPKDEMDEPKKEEEEPKKKKPLASKQAAAANKKDEKVEGKGTKKRKEPIKTSPTKSSPTKKKPAPAKSKKGKDAEDDDDESDEEMGTPKTKGGKLKRLVKKPEVHAVRTCWVCERLTRTFFVG